MGAPRPSYKAPYTESFITCKGLGEVSVPKEALVSSSPLGLSSNRGILKYGAQALLCQSYVSAVGIEELLTKDTRVASILYQLHEPAVNTDSGAAATDLASPATLKT